jgi:primosomal protein N'
MQSTITIGTNLFIHPRLKTDILVLINADQWLQFPDYNSRWNAFLQLYEAIMKHPGKQIILQSYHCEDRLILLACKWELLQAQKQELGHRNILSYPPFVDMCLFLYKDEIEEKLFSSIHKLHKEILYLQEKWERKDISVIATPPLIYKLHGKFRYSILFKGTNLRPFICEIYEKLEIKKRGFLVDRMPVTTL